MAYTLIEYLMLTCHCRAPSMQHISLENINRSPPAAGLTIDTASPRSLLGAAAGDLPGAWLGDSAQHSPNKHWPLSPLRTPGASLDDSATLPLGGEPSRSSTQSPSSRAPLPALVSSSPRPWPVGSAAPLSPHSIRLDPLGQDSPHGRTPSPPSRMGSKAVPRSTTTAAAAAVVPSG